MRRLIAAALWLVPLTMPACGRNPPVVRAGAEGAQPGPALAAAPAHSSLSAPPRQVQQVAREANAPGAPATRRFERAAGLRPELLMAVGGGALYRFEGGRWTRIALVGAEARDVVAARGALWILARGTGENEGTAVVLRATRDDVRTVAAPSLGSASDPRALAVVREGEYYVGGFSPALVRITPSALEPVRVGGERVLSLRLVRDDMLIAMHDAGRVSTARWGEFDAVEVPDYLDTVATPEGRAVVVDARGAFVRGRPGHPLGAWAGPAPFAPTVAAVLADGRPALAGAGRFAVWTRGTWHEVSGELPAEPIALLPSTPPLVIGRQGEVVAVEAESVQVLGRGGD